MRVELQNLQVLHGVNCQIDLPGGQSETVTVSLIRCSADPDLEPIFLRLMGGLIGEFGGPSAGELSKLVTRLVDLFRALTQPPRKSVQGLWGELLLIAMGTSPIELVSSWHVDVSDMYDFNAGGQRIEVKTSSSRGRTHHFRLEQLIPPIGTELVVSSLVVESSGGGETINDLVTEVEGRLGHRADLVIRLEAVVADTLGMDWRSSAHAAFDREVARDSLRFLPVADIPTISSDNIPGTVTNVHFAVNVDGVAGMNNDHLNSLGGLLAAAGPSQEAVRRSAT